VAGFGFYSLTVFVHALTADGVFTLEQASRGSSLYLVTAGLGGVAVAALLARLDVRWVLGGGAVLMAVGLLLLGQADQPRELYTADLLIGLGQAGAGVVPGTTVVARWFVHNRGTAMAVASTGLSVGGIVVAPLVGLALQRHSLRSVTAVSSVVFLAVCLLAVTFVRARPPGEAEDDDAQQQGLSRREALRTGTFWGVSAAMTLAVLAQVGGLTHLYTMVSERGSASVAGGALSSVALGSLSGRFLGSWVLARVSTSVFFRVLLVVQAGSLAVLATGSSAAVLLASSALFGLTIGNVILTHPLLLGEVFGLRDFARVLSFSGLVSTAGTASGPLVVGQLAASAGGYRLGFLAVGAASLAGAVVLHLTARERHLGGVLLPA
jgi:predicted MFS family arabinose efflux permease